MQISVLVTFDATNQTMSVSDSGLITFPQNTSDFSIVTVNGMDCITPTTVSTSNTYYVQFEIASSVEETEFDAYIDISNTQYSFNYWFELVSNGSPNQYSLVYNSGGVWWNPDRATVNLPTQQWYTVKIVNNDSIKIYDKSTGTLVHSRSFAGSLNVISLANFYGAASYLANLTLKRTINTEQIRYANTSGIAEIWANIKNWVSAHIGNGTLTIQKNGTDVTTFSANSSSNATANITVPTKVSDLTNDSGFLTTANIPSKTSDLTNDSGFLTSHQSLSNYVTLNGSQTLTATKAFTTSINTASTATSQRETWRLVFNKDSADTDSTTAAQIGVFQGANSHDFSAVIRLANPRANNKPTTGNTSNCWSGIGVYYNYDENKGYPYALYCWDWPTSSNSTNELASTSWVRTYCETTKGFLTSHQSLSNYVTIDTAQDIEGNKNFKGLLTTIPNGTIWPVTASTTDDITYLGANAIHVEQKSSGKLTDLSGGAWSVAELGVGCFFFRINNGADIRYKNFAQNTVNRIPVVSGANRFINDVTPNENNTHSLGTSSLRWSSCYSNAYYLGTTAFGDIVTHNASEFLTSHQSLSNYITLNGTQTITGTKTFSAIQYFNEYKLVVKATNQTVGTTPKSNKWNGMIFQDTAGTNTFTIENGHLKNGSTQLNLCCTPNISGAAKELFLQYYCGTTEGASTLNILTASATAPTPATSDNSTKIATTAFVKAQGYLTSHQSLSNYSTLANTVKSLSISGKTITVTPGSGKAYTLTTQDTVYTHPTSAGNKHIPSGGSSGQILKYSASGTAVWADVSFTRQMVSIATDSFDNTLLNRTKAVTLTKSQLAVVTVDLTTVSDSFVKLTASNIFVVAVHTLVGNNVYKQDSVNYGCILQQGAAGRTRVVALIFPYNTSVEFTLAKVSGSVNPFKSYSLTVYQ